MFGSSRKIYTDTSIVPVIEEKYFVDTLSYSIFESSIRNIGIPENLIQNYVYSMPFNVRKYYRFAENKYPDAMTDRALIPGNRATGVRERANVWTRIRMRIKEMQDTSYETEIEIDPSSSNLALDALQEAISKQLPDLLGSGRVNAYYISVGGLNVIHWARSVITNQYGYKGSTNELRTLSSQIGEKVYLENLIPIFPSEYALAEGGEQHIDLDVPGTSGQTEERSRNENRSHTQPGISNDPDDAEIISVLVDYCWWTDEVEIIETTDEEGNAITEENHYRQRHDDSLTLTMPIGRYFERHIQVKYTVDEFFMFGSQESDPMYYTYRFQDGTEPQFDSFLQGSSVDTREYYPMVVFIDGKKDQTREDLRDSERFKMDEKLLDILKLDYLAIGEAIQDEENDLSDVEQAFLTFAATAVGGTEAESEYCFRHFDAIVNEQGNGTRSGPYSEDIKVRNRFFGYGYKLAAIHKTTNTGVKGKVGSYHSDQRKYEWSTFTYVYRRKGSLIDNIGKRKFPRRDRSDLSDFELVPLEHKHVKFYTSFYRQISENKYIQIEVDSLENEFLIRPDVAERAQLDDERLLVPINIPISEKMLFKNREQLLQSSLKIVVNALKIVSVSWYKRALSVILQIAAIALVIYTGGTSLKALAAAAALGSMAFAIAVLKMVITFVITDFGFKFVVDKLGEDWAFYLALAAAAAGGYQAINHGSVQGAPYASEMLQISNGLANAVNPNMAGVEQEFADLQAEIEAGQAEIDRALELLETDRTVNPLIFVAGETPSNFYERTVHSGNIGPRVYDLLERYVELSLRLPTIHDTLGDKFNA